MKLRQYLAYFFTEAVTTLAIISSMWAFTKKDLLEIIVVAMMFAPALALIPLALMEMEDPEELEEPEEPEEKRRHFMIYTLTEENYYGRKIS